VPNHERNHGMKEKTVLSLSYGRIVIKPAEKLHGLVPESFETYQIVNPGDIVLRTTDLQNDHTSLRVGMVRDRGIITSAYLALRTSPEVSSEFGFQVLNVWDSSKGGAPRFLDSVDPQIVWSAPRLQSRQIDQRSLIAEG
jgi:type I restriction enzyme S subunit